MIGLRSGESGKAYSIGRPYNPEGTSIGQVFGQIGEITGHYDIRKGSVTNLDALTTSPTPGRCQTPVGKPLRMEKVRKQRSYQTSSTDAEEQTTNICSQTNTEAPVTRRHGRRGIAFPRLTLRKRVSAQEVVSLVKDAYYSRPSLNLSRSRVAPGLGEEHSRNSSGEARMPIIQTRPSDTTASSGFGPQPFNGQRVENLSSSSSFSHTVLRKLSARHKRALRPKRRSRSLDDDSSLSVNRRTSISSNITLTSGVLKASTADSGSGSVSSIRPVACKYGPVESPVLIPGPQLPPKQQDTITRSLASAPSSTSREPCLRENATVQMQITPEFRELDVTATATLWVAIQARHLIPQSVYERTRQTPVKFVILIDNASYTSDLLALNRSCTLVLAIAYQLTLLADCLAVFATACCHEDQVDMAGCQLHPLKTPTMRILRKELDNLRNARPKRGGDISCVQHSASDRLSQMLDSVVSLVMEDEPSSRIPWNHHFVILSCNRVDTSVRRGSTVTIHHIDPAWLEYMGPPCISRIELRYPLELIGDWAKHLVKNARASVEARPLHNITIDVQPGFSTRLQRVVGECSRAFLAAGQEISLLVELAVTEINSARLCVSAPELDNIDPALTVEEAMDDLNYMLGETLQSILVVTSSFEENDETNDHEDSLRHRSVDQTCCRIKRCNAASVWSATRFSDGSKAVHEILLGLANRCYVYMFLVLELVCAARVEESLDLLTSIKAKSDLSQKAIHQVDILRTRLLQVLFCLNTKTLASNDNTVTDSSRPDPLPIRPLNGNSDASPDQAITTSPESARAPGSLSPPHAFKENDDTARRIWGLMRRDSKTDRPLELAAAGEELHDLESRSKEARQLRRKALANQRSAGADTLRSLALSALMSGTAEFAAPWI